MINFRYSTSYLLIHKPRRGEERDGRGGERRKDGKRVREESSYQCLQTHAQRPAEVTSISENIKTSS